MLACPAGPDPVTSKARAMTKAAESVLPARVIARLPRDASEAISSGPPTAVACSESALSTEGTLPAIADAWRASLDPVRLPVLARTVVVPSTVAPTAWAFPATDWARPSVGQAMRPPQTSARMIRFRRFNAGRFIAFSLKIGPAAAATSATVPATIPWPPPHPVARADRLEIPFRPAVSGACYRQVKPSGGVFEAFPL